MTTEEVHIKIKNNLNKLDSHDYDNFEAWQINSAFNIAQLSWVRRNLHGANYFREGDESSKIRIDDFQILLKTYSLTLQKEDKHYVAYPIPSDYLLFKRLDVKAKKGCCDNTSLIAYLSEQSNVNLLLNDELRKPSFEWRETFCTLMGNKIQIWTNDEFDISEATLLYYSTPTNIELINTYNISTQSVSTATVNPMFKDDIVEIIINETCKILAGNIESINQINIQSSNVETNN